MKKVKLVKDYESMKHSFKQGDVIEVNECISFYSDYYEYDGWRYIKSLFEEV
jgi:hypothetical protein